MEKKWTTATCETCVHFTYHVLKNKKSSMICKLTMQPESPNLTACGMYKGVNKCQPRAR